jgi:hypothetical protein
MFIGVVSAQVTVEEGCGRGVVQFQQSDSTSQSVGTVIITEFTGPGPGSELVEWSVDSTTQYVINDRARSLKQICNLNFVAQDYIIMYWQNQGKYVLKRIELKINWGG